MGVEIDDTLKTWSIINSSAVATVAATVAAQKGASEAATAGSAAAANLNVAVEALALHNLVAAVKAAAAKIDV